MFLTTTRSSGTLHIFGSMPRAREHLFCPTALKSWSHSLDRTVWIVQSGSHSLGRTAILSPRPSIITAAHKHSRKFLTLTPATRGWDKKTSQQIFQPAGNIADPAIKLPFSVSIHVREQLRLQKIIHYHEKEVFPRNHRVFSHTVMLRAERAFSQQPI